MHCVINHYSVYFKPQTPHGYKSAYPLVKFSESYLAVDIWGRKPYICGRMMKKIILLWIESMILVVT
jgi:hypothetical protein